MLLRPLAPILAFTLSIVAWGSTAAPVNAQPAEVPALRDAPVRYDDDHLGAAEHRARRDALLNALPGDAVALVFSAPVRNRQNDVDFEYRQNSDLLYLTGTHEPGSVLLLAPGGVQVEGETVVEVLFVPPRDPAYEIWEGRRFGAERAQADLGIQRAVSYEQFEAALKPVLVDADRGDGTKEGGRTLYLLPRADGIPEGSTLAEQLTLIDAHLPPFVLSGRTAQMVFDSLVGIDNAEAYAGMRTMLGLAPDTDPTEQGAQTLALVADDALVQDVLDAVRDHATYAAWSNWRDAFLANKPDTRFLRSYLDQARSIKSEAELALLQEAIDITGLALTEAIRSIEPGMAEYEVEALIEYVFKRNGAESPGYPSIVGSGENAVILHYTSNRRPMEAGDMLVMDVGAEVRGYTADVTRSVPVDGTFSDAQRAVYTLVLRANEAAIDATRAGNDFRAPHRAAQTIIADGLIELGLIDDPAEVRRFFMHGTSHYLGLDVHDAGDYGPLQPGQVITIEPGIYIAASADVPEAYWNLGVRIEDDVLVTDGDPIVLSATIPKTLAAIEALMAEQGLGNETAGTLKP
ncbi:MAG: aminopeptidase P N-terminal domain-containing protein [Bacteroidota bacterium]